MTTCLVTCAATAGARAADEPFLPQWALRTEIVDPPADTSTVGLEAADVALFGIAQLRLSGVRAHRRFGRWIGLASVSRTGTPVGTYNRLAVGGAHLGKRQRWSTGVYFDTFGAAGARSRPTVTLRVAQQTRLSDTWWIRGRVMGLPLRGDQPSKTNLALVGTTEILTAASLSFGMEVDRINGAAFLFSVRYQPLPSFTIAFGYDGAAETPGVAASLAVGELTVSSAFRSHPVLGESHGASVSWSR